VFWTANLVFALAFGAAHLPTAAARGLPLTALVITGTLVLNALGGLAFGWLFWTFGLESAILAHFFADVIMYTLIPFIEMQQAEAARYLAIVSVAAAILVALIWACRLLSVERRKPHSQTIH
jgi:hypothetical protein